jgi:hypothetical protein
MGKIKDLKCISVMKEGVCVAGYGSFNSSTKKTGNLKFWQYVYDGCDVLCKYGQATGFLSCRWLG